MLNDSLRSGEVRKSLMQFEFRKDLMADSLQMVQQMQVRMEQEQRSRETRYWLGGIVAFLLLGGLLYNQQRKSHRRVTVE